MLDLGGREAMLKKLAESGLTEADAKQRGVHLLVNGEAQELIGRHRIGIMIPYYATDGKPKPESYRVRVLGANPKPKYKQPPGKVMGTPVYFDPSFPWKDFTNDVKKPLVITEGEFKCMCACKLGIPTIGVGGVWSFKSNTKRQTLIPDLEQFQWADRKVYLCYDSDATSNVMVLKAENELARQLTNRGADVRIVRLPSLGKGKTGLDDYLMHKEGGAKKFAQLRMDAEAWLEGAELREFNAEVIFIKDPGTCVVRATGQLLDSRSLVTPQYADRKFLKPDGLDKKDKPKFKEASVPAEWLQWPGRSVAQCMTYKPGEPRLTTDGCYNTWTGWGVEAKKGNIGPWKRLLQYMFKDEALEARKWFEQWCAAPIQKPGLKLYTACVLWSVAQGTGKTMLGYTLGRVYGKNYKEIHDTDLESSFNGFLTQKQFILGDEITGPTNTDRKKLANKIKGMITRHEISVNEKYVKEYTLPDCVNYLFTSNHCDTFFLENADRRYFVVEIKSKPLPPSFYKEYDRWYHSEDGIAALRYYLEHIDMKGFDPTKAAPMTSAKLDMIEDSRSDLAAAIMQLPTMFDDPKTMVHRLMTEVEIADKLNGGVHHKNGWGPVAVRKVLKELGFVRPLHKNKRTQLLLDDRKQVVAWLIDKSIPITGHPSQKEMRDLWYSDRPAEMPKKFMPKEKQR